MANFNTGDLVVVTLAMPSGYRLGRTTSAAVVEEAYGDPDNTFRVRLTGLTPAPYDPGMVLVVSGGNVAKAGW